jgi:hypothetical protein
MDLEAIENALGALILSLLASVPDAAVQWENRPREIVVGPTVFLSWVSGVGVGVDERRWEDSAAAKPEANMVPTTAGFRRLVLQVAPEVVANQLPGRHAHTIAEKVRTGFARRSTKAALRAANLGLISVGGATTADYESDDHLVSRCVVEVALNATSYDRDDDGAVGSLERVEVTSHVSDVGGDLLPDAEQMNAEVIP